jgi:hypothetical protein
MHSDRWAQPDAAVHCTKRYVQCGVAIQCQRIIIRLLMPDRDPSAELPKLESLKMI